MKTRQEQKEQRYKDILLVSLDLFIRKGYSATKVKDIADEMNMSVGLLFHYFESKERLYIELIKMGVLGPKQVLSEIDDVNPLLFFETCAKQTLSYAKNSMFTAKMFLLMGNAIYNEGIPEEAKKIASSINFYEETMPIIVRGQQEGTIRQGDPLSLATTFWTALQGIIQMYALNENMQLPDSEWIVDIIRAKEKTLL
ncbi:TetR family transcriptional regulator [Breznakia blatticola]|uniref:TetR family transcriptional regulator n=1 Tax=Breznakia blatticola TaxID=1754012 RepID=A0A4R8A6E8_9FIRM|nr:TetR/AcrR family transcriptional regulator [Breznakia blatticola]TDW26016.1 TetR family transcriptional regulator [Breznakia blatticola]